jgi:uncharacterized protein YbjT (DUF2867 family)
MKILLTGANGYIGKRLLPVLLEAGHEVICCVRNELRFNKDDLKGNVKVFEVDFANEVDLDKAPTDFDAAYYLIHSMSSSGKFEEMEQKTAENFAAYVEKTRANQIIYLSGIVNDENLSPHLRSRLNVEQILMKADVHTTVLRAGIIVGSGSASFEIIRDLVEKLPVMIAPRWVGTRTQPIAIRDVITMLEGVLQCEACYDGVFDIGGPEVMTYRDMLMQYASVRKLRRFIIQVPVLSPRLSSYWLFFVTSTSYTLAANLVDSMKVEVVARNNDLQKILNVEPITYKEAVKNAFQKMEQNMVFSSWKDSFISSAVTENLLDYVQVPKYGCFKDRQTVQVSDTDIVAQNIWSIGGDRGWYYGNWLWGIRGFLDQLVGGVGLRRGRTHPSSIRVGDSLDFWRVIAVDEKKMRLLLYAEMKLPGEAWLEFCINTENKDKPKLVQEATFRPNGLGGRLYWYGLWPLHYFVFRGMIKNLTRYRVAAPVSA